MAANRFGGSIMVKQWPKYLKWRNGRPRWEPGPALRAKGIPGRDCKYPDGSWMTRGDAVDLCDRINAGTAADQEQAAGKPNDRTLGALLDRIEQLPKFRDEAPADGKKRRRLSKTTRQNYLYHQRILREWAGDKLVASLKRDHFNALYDSLVEGRGQVAANRIMASAHRVMAYAMDDLEWITRNPVRGLERLPEEGRLVMWTADETAAFVRCADWLGMEDIADAHILGLLTCQSRKDVLALPELELDRGVFRVRRFKTGRVAFVPATAPLRSRIELMRRRKAERFAGVAYSHELISMRTGAPFSLDGSHFTHEYAMVRAVASGLQQAIDQAFPIGRKAIDYSTAPFVPMPSIWDKRFHDLRDTGVTLLYEATGGNKALVANISGHSLKTIDQIIDKHYFVRNEQMSRDAGGMLEDLMKRIGYAG